MKRIAFFTLALTWLVLYACHDDKSSGSASVGFYLTDAPAYQDYKAVNVDIRSISYSIDNEEWKTLSMTPVIVNLLEFNNGKDTLLSNIVLNEGSKIKQIRLLLGNKNTLTLTDNSVVNMDTPSGQSSGLKVNVQSVAEVTSGYKVVIDFDAARSIVAKGNGGYSLKPVIRAYIAAHSSVVSGNLTPDTLMIKVFTVTSAGDTIATISDPGNNNYFQLHGLFSGTYDIKAEDLSTQEIIVLKQGLNVIGGTNVNLGTIALPMIQ